MKNELVLKKYENNELIFRNIKSSDEILKQWRYEIQFSKQIKSKFILQALEVHKATNSLIYEKFAITSIKELLQKKLLSFEEKVNISILLVEALRDIHLSKFVFLSLNPSKILYNKETKRLKIFDLSKISQFKNSFDLNEDLKYISPEQTGRTNRSVDYRSDFYILGIVLYELFYEEAAFLEEDTNKLIYKHLALDVHFPVDESIGNIIPKIIKKLINKSKEDRYQSHKSLLEDLFHVLKKKENFILAKNDINSQFVLPQGLYGRKKEIHILNSIFESSIKQGSKFALVSGYSGVGKSRLVHELIPLIKSNNGFFIEGKFEQFKKDIPYWALTNAISSFIDYLFTLPSKEYLKWKKKLNDNIGSSLQLIANLLPKLNDLIIHKEKLEKLDSIQEQKRFHDTFIKLLKCFCDENNPLVIFLDDLQWIDNASLKLIESIFLNLNHKGLFLIGSYRNNEVHSSHTLSQMLWELEQNNINYNEIKLLPLVLQDLKVYISHTLKKTEEEVDFLAKALHETTEGNPFFLEATLKQLYEKGIIYFDDKQALWFYKKEELKNIKLCENVVDLMIQKLKKYDKRDQFLLSLASLIGSSFSLELLSKIINKPLKRTLYHLQIAIEDKLIYPKNDSYLFYDDTQELKNARFRFSHDKVQQASNLLMDESKIKEFKLKIAMQFLENKEEVSIFQIVEQLNMSIELIKDSKQRIEFAKLNLKASLQAKKASAFFPAKQYLKSAKKFLGSDLHENLSLSIEIYRELAQNSYLSGDFELANHCYEVLKDLKMNKLEKIKYLLVQANQYQLQGRFKEALEVIDEGISLVDIKFPSQKQDLEELLNKEYFLLQSHIKKCGNIKLNLNEMEDPLMLLVMQLMRVQWYASYLIGNNILNAVVSLTMTRLSLQMGNSDVSAFAFVTSALVANIVKNDPLKAKMLGSLALELANKRDNKSIRGVTYLLYTTFTHPWHNSIQSSIPYFKIAWECSEETNDYVSAGYVINVRSTDSLIASINLNSLEKQYIQEINYLQKVKQKDMEDATLAGGLQAVRALLGKTQNNSFDDEGFNEQSYLKEYSNAGLHQAYFYQARIRHAYIMEDENLRHYANKYLLVEQFVPGQAKVFEANFYSALIYLSLAKSDNCEEFKIAFSIYEKFLIWQENCKGNFEHKSLLLLAEISRVKNESIKAQQNYEKAIESSIKYGFSNVTALAYEVYAKFAKVYDLNELMKMCLQKSYFWYGYWGAVSKQKSLINKWKSFNIDFTKQSNEDFFEEESLFDSLNKLSKTLKRDAVTDIFIQTVTKYSGATNASLIYIEQDKFHVIGSYIKRVDKVKKFDLEEFILDGKNNFLPENLINYTFKTKQAQIYNSPVEWSSLGINEYLEKKKPLSIIVQPLINKEGVIAILYLEHSHLSHAFNNKIVQSISLISQQAATSMDNAILYEHMERRIKNRTEELEIQKEKAEENTKAKSQFLANMSHEIRTPLHGILGMSHLILQTQLSKKQENYIQKIDSSSRNLLEIINDILDFSKIEAGQLSLDKQEFDLFKIIENITALLELKIHEKKLDLVIDFDTNIAKTFYGDSLRLSQVLTNLLSNAVKFTNSGEICIFIRRIRNDRYEFEVKDTGIGLTQKEQKKLFKSFSQADNSTTRKFGGTGLGLSISKQLVELMNGKIWLESKKDLGSSFFFEVDLEEVEFIEKTFSFQSKKVLVLESNLKWQKILEKSLKVFDLEVEISNKIDTLQKNNYDLILLDWLIIKDTNLSDIKKGLLKDCKLAIIVDNINYDLAVKHTKNLGINFFFLKPLNISILSEVLSNIFLHNKNTQYSFEVEKSSLKNQLVSLRGSNILLVEDNLINQDIVLGLLENTDINIDLAQNGQEAVNLIFENPKKYELILMDIQMPVMDGLEASKIIRQKDEKIPIIALSANAMTEDKEESKNVKITEHLDKPINVNKLYNILLKYISKKDLEFRKVNIEDEINKDFPMLKNIDIKKGLSFLGNNNTLYKNILNNFYKDYVNINFNALLDKDFYIILHTIKGLSANIGANNLSSIAKKIEDIKDRRLISSLNEELYKVLKDIESINTSESKNIKKKKILEKEKRDTLFKSLLQACKTKLIKKCEPLIKELEEYELLEDDLILFEQVKKELKRYRFKEIINLLEDDGK